VVGLRAQTLEAGVARADALEQVGREQRPLSVDGGEAVPVTCLHSSSQGRQEDENAQDVGRELGLDAVADAASPRR